MKAMKIKYLAPLLIAGGFLFPAQTIQHYEPVGYSDVECMTANIYFEAANQSYKGKLAVGAVTLNRTASSKYPKTICEVVFEKKQFSWTHKKPWATIQTVMQGKIDSLSTKDQVAWLQSREIAENHGKILKVKLPTTTLWYHADYVSPKWKGKLKYVTKIGSHVFYRN